MEMVKSISLRRTTIVTRRAYSLIREMALSRKRSLMQLAHHHILSQQETLMETEKSTS